MPIENCIDVPSKSIVCPSCKRETMNTIITLMATPIQGDILCEHCNEVVVSCIPEKRGAYTTYHNNSAYVGVYGEYD